MGVLHRDMSPLSHFLFLFTGNKVSEFVSGICSQQDMLPQPKQQSWTETLKPRVKTTLSYLKTITSGISHSNSTLLSTISYVLIEILTEQFVRTFLN